MPLISQINEKNKVIILNKPFLGDWLDNEGNIAHEIIDFLHTDNGDYFIYNNPWGICPDKIDVENSKNVKGDKDKYFAKYLVLTSNNQTIQSNKDSTNDSKKFKFKILYVIELVEKMHNLHTAKNNDKKTLAKLDDEKYKKIVGIIRENKIKYNNKYLDEIFENDGTLYVTFRASKLYKAEIPIPVENLSYNFQRNKGYVYQDQYEDDYNKLIAIIEEKIKSKELVELSEIPSLIGNKLQSCVSKTFMSLIGSEYNEQLYTNMLFNVLKHKNMFVKFLKYFQPKVNIESSAFEVFREKQVKDGRIDICAESEKYKVVIENKVLSDLNGVKENITQLTTYYNWANDTKNKKPICFIVAPNFRVKEIDQEINVKDQAMNGKYNILTYGDIAKFLEKEISMLKDKEFEYHDLAKQIIQSFKNFSYDTVEKLYAQMFLEATKSVGNKK